ncbi:hypothetical protein AVV02_gp201 [Bacillus phage AvesoBmore]|uniref:Uncharacterized protein n=1 Tax=Bacillus phage AvesoBmore TaxID=1698451 RepID=A0A0K2D0L2_9CAUD|nr:hypothetical protein AVV02_gp201 [Bacillus phage AvesoBmore]ALA13364.1 hypothetical protein AVESOBMORE_201 [Bacillus phage AvesoBmore]
MITMVQAPTPDRPEEKLVKFMTDNSFSKADIYEALNNIEEAKLTLHNKDWGLTHQSNYVFVKGELMQ